MGDVSLDDILVTPLKRIPTVGGDVLHALKKTDAGFDGFGEIYFYSLKGLLKWLKLFFQFQHTLEII